MELKICHLYPDVLNLYGDRGNIICMEKRLHWRGIDVVTTGVSIGETLNAADYDLFFIGGGQDFDQESLLADLKGDKTAQIKSAIEDGKTFLAICGGYQMLGAYYQSAEGQCCDFTGALDLYTVGAKNRMIGDYAFSCTDPDTVVVGFENHSGKTFLGSGVRPMGTVLAGFGNNGEDHTEGARYKNVYGTYAHGCLLPKNPVLCDHILKEALVHKYGTAELAPLDDTLERNAHDYMVNRLCK
jgi:CobQ-like glutamine amidotransferase family enzyme